jgi:hypothetical protein
MLRRENSSPDPDVINFFFFCIVALTTTPKLPFSNPSSETMTDGLKFDDSISNNLQQQQ